jgi:hypothetical protein
MHTKSSGLINLPRASSIALLVDISSGVDTLENKAVFEYAQSLRKLGKDVKVFAFTTEAKVPEGLDFDCFCKKDLNWALVPKGAKVDEFLSKEFDILISLYFSESQPLDFIAQAARVKLRVGYYREGGRDFYDLMVHNKSKNFEKALKQINQALMMINA